MTAADHTTADHTPTRPVFLVVDPRGGTAWASADRDRAHEWARNTGQIVVELPALADYSKEDGR